MGFSLVLCSLIRIFATKYLGLTKNNYGKKEKDSSRNSERYESDAFMHRSDDGCHRYAYRL
jgi:hypothetical protein